MKLRINIIMEDSVKKKMSKFLFLLGLFSFNSKAQDLKLKPWVYFDLGETVVSTKDMKHIKYMPGAKVYIEDLKREGFNVGIITNIPETWGMNYQEKLETLKKVIQDGWDDTQPFDWAVYDEVILPLKNSEMKPAPTLFQKAIMRSESCPSMYIGESIKEIDAAKNLGMAAHLFDENAHEKYIPIDSVTDFIEVNYKLEYERNCLR
jgi:phosphoglycolate phosphatase-like HAD superfamily hydrolase